jgi:hypothetical protein
MTIYLVTLDDGSTFRMSADLVQAAAPISVDFHGEDNWQSTPYQTADARHDCYRAATLANDYFRGADDDSEVDAVDLVAEPDSDEWLIRQLARKGR